MTMIMKTLHASRGSALLITLIALAVLMVIVVGAIQFTGINREGAAAKLRGDSLAACGEAAKRQLVSQLALFGGGVNNVPLTGPVDVRIPDRATVSERSRIMLAHYDELDAGMEDIQPVSSGLMGSSARGARDLSNAAPSSTSLGGTYYRVVMKCQDFGGRESEVEFLFRFGI